VDQQSAKAVYEIDGRDFSTLEEFAQVVSQVLFDGYQWRGNLDAFNDILRGGFGTPDDGFILRWKNSELSRQRLGYGETIRWLEERAVNCHPSNREHMRDLLSKARRNEGETVFDWLVEIIEVHCSGGDEEEDGVELELL
jgi:hypothetical protein